MLYPHKYCIWLIRQCKIIQNIKNNDKQILLQNINPEFSTMPLLHRDLLHSFMLFTFKKHTEVTKPLFFTFHTVKNCDYIMSSFVLTEQTIKYSLFSSCFHRQKKKKTGRKLKTTFKKYQISGKKTGSICPYCRNVFQAIFIIITWWMLN